LDPNCSKIATIVASDAATSADLHGLSHWLNLAKNDATGAEKNKIIRTHLPGNAGDQTGAQKKFERWWMMKWVNSDVELFDVDVRDGKFESFLKGLNCSKYCSNNM
jgi:hypothetical protein